MNKKLKISALALCVVAAALTANAGTTNLLQAVSISFASYSQGTPVVTSVGTNNVVNHTGIGTKDLIKAISASGEFNSGDVLVRATPVTNVPVAVTNLVPVSTNILVITNTSTSELSVSNELILGTNLPIFIGDTNVTFGTNTADIDGSTVTLGTNNATYGTNTLFIGTNTTVTVITLTNAVGNNVGTSNIFVINALPLGSTTTNKLGTAAWAIYNHGTLTPISTNVYFNIYTDSIYKGINSAYIHGETIKRDGQIEFGTTYEIRTLVLSNSTATIQLKGYAHGRIVAVSLGGSQVVYSQDYNWTGSGSGITNSIPVVMDGDVSEQYFKLLK